MRPTLRILDDDLVAGIVDEAKRIAELRRIIRDGLVTQDELPELPPLPGPVAADPDARGRRRNLRRGG